MAVKRILVGVISLIVGLLLTFLSTRLLGTTPAEYGTIYFLMTTIAFGCAVGIWLDRFIGTDILPE